MSRPGAHVLAVDALTLKIRAALQGTPLLYRGPALAYELAAACAAVAPDEATALALVDEMGVIMRDQICRLGVGRAHP